MARWPDVLRRSNNAHFCRVARPVLQCRRAQLEADFFLAAVFFFEEEPFFLAVAPPLFFEAFFTDFSCLRLSVSWRCFSLVRSSRFTIYR